MSTHGYIEILLFSSGNFIISYIFSLKSLIRLEFILVYGVGEGPDFIFLQMATKVVSNHLLILSYFSH